MNEDVVICRMCDKKFKAISRTHLKSHDMTMEEYKLRFPNSPMQSLKTRKKLATNSLNYWVKKHGPELGEKKYKKYRGFLAEKNTFKYKKEKYGWSKEKFDAFNKSRAVTLENLCKRHGEEYGRKLYEDYIEKQRYVGVKEDYFIEKLGELEGKKRYKELGREKAHTLETYIKRYGSRNMAKEKLREFFSKTEGSEFSSALEREFIYNLLNQLDLKNYEAGRIYSILNEQQYGIWSDTLEKYVKYDLVFLDKKICIEFNGDYWHCNPVMYTEDYIHPVLKKKANELWETDQKKLQSIQNRGFFTKSIWEFDYRNDKDKTIKETIKWIQELNALK
jgi:G:T-mismatch repair DNA endonuclease (very short patch repair protein)